MIAQRGATVVSRLDLRSEQKPQKGDHALDRKGRVIVRDPKTIDTVCMHQTACVFGPLADPPTRHRRALKIASHATAFNDGVAVLQTPVRWYVNGGGRWNKRAVHLEGEGHFPGVPDDPTTPHREDIASVWGNKPTTWDDAIRDTMMEALCWLVEEARAEGCPIEWIVAHRQSAKTRRSDPGHDVWRDIVLGYAVPVLGLKTRPSIVLGDGRPIPKLWGEGSAPY